MINNIHIPSLLEKSTDFNPKEFQQTLKNINLKLHFEYALLLITELLDVPHIKMINIHGGNGNTFMLNEFGPYNVETASEKFNVEKNSKGMGRYAKLYFDEEYANLKESEKKKIMSQLKKRSQ